MVEAEQDEEGGVDGEEGDELRVVGGHSVFLVDVESGDGSWFAEPEFEELVEYGIEAGTSEECYLKLKLQY